MKNGIEGLMLKMAFLITIAIVLFSSTPILRYKSLYL